MQQIFLICATIGGTILILRLILSLLGLGLHGGDGPIGHFGDSHIGGDHLDGGHEDGHHSNLGRIFTFQAIVSFLAFFGVGGLSALEAKQGPAVSVLVGIVTGVVAVTLLGYALGTLHKLNADGTVRIADSVGLEGRVYLRIPAHGEGMGKVTLPIQGRTIEVLARTPGPELRTGEPVIVHRVLDEQTVEVVSPQSHVVKPVALVD